MTEPKHRRVRTLAIVVAAVIAASVAIVLSSLDGKHDLYVSTSGDDSWDGSLERPFASLKRAQEEVRALNDSMSADITVHVRGGTYRLTEPLEFNGEADSGRDGHRVVYQAYGYGTSAQERVTISGGRKVSDWDTENGVWSAKVGDLRTRQLYVDGDRALRAGLGGGIPGDAKATKTGYTTDSTAPQSWKDPQNVEFVYTLALYTDRRCGVEDVTGSESGSTITMDSECWELMLAEADDPVLGEEGELPSEPTDIVNSRSFLDRAGSWFLDRTGSGEHTLFYKPLPGQEPGNTEVVAPRLETLVDGSGGSGERLHDVDLNGFTFAEATWLAPDEPSGFVSSWSSYSLPGEKARRTVPGNVRFRDSDRIRLRGNTFTRLGGQGLEISSSSSGFVVAGNEFTGISDGGIVMGLLPPDTTGEHRDNRIADNWVHGIGVENRAASGIWLMGTKDATVEHNQVNDVPHMGILAGRDPDVPDATSGTRILGNLVIDSMQRIGDGGGIYLRGSQGDSYADGALVKGNVVTNARTDAGGFFNIGIYTDDGSKWVTVADNASYDNLAAIGGCDESPRRPVDRIRFTGNFWDDAVPEGIDRMDFPGAWPCGQPHHVSFTGNTTLSDVSPARACRSNLDCATILKRAGLSAEYRELLRDK